MTRIINELRIGLSLAIDQLLFALAWGVFIGVVFATAFPICLFVVRYAPRIMKSMGAW